MRGSFKSPFERVGFYLVVLIFVATRFAARLVDGLFRAVEAGEVSLPWVHPDTAQPTRRLATVLIGLAVGLILTVLIAAVLAIAEGTVKAHLSSILRGLDVQNRVQAAMRTVQHRAE